MPHLDDLDSVALGLFPAMPIEGADSELDQPAGMSPLHDPCERRRMRQRVTFEILVEVGMGVEVKDIDRPVHRGQSLDGVHQPGVQIDEGHQQIAGAEHINQIADVQIADAVAFGHQQFQALDELISIAIEQPAVAAQAVIDQHVAAGIAENGRAHRQRLRGQPRGGEVLLDGGDP